MRVEKIVVLEVIVEVAAEQSKKRTEEEPLPCLMW